MQTAILSLLTRTPLHVGAGASVGVVDLPVQRERHTQIPIIPGSSLKGVLRDLWNGDKETQRRLFGNEPGAGSGLVAGHLLVGEARTLAFPVRAARGSFAWLTCPLAVRRYRRDRGLPALDLPKVSEDQVFAGRAVTVGDSVVLEDYRFKAQPLPESLKDLLHGVMPGEPLVDQGAERLVFVSDGMFSYFCATACEVQQRIRIDDETKVVAQGALFNQENVPSETLLYAVLAQRNEEDVLKVVEKKLSEVGKVLQIGADETVGLGFCSVHLQAAAAETKEGE
ncbi:MAG TPA: type III-B CRISPR module RAMP protein Cmr4 [Acidobacteriota bacterium]|nr:type III-B CRISPR module RAMP protein Cmr4 [Acidobacteriota bacterium]HRR25118.1 type III-B CRISPR module RAMP protein Cmr4 [Acidobacteriota bacterium]HRR56224.1 type III-B CRISPR module RAMP protein Cmr4 [Acidobacteriota bacterium]HRV07269.1 type III-B CRISPR module RAMP protein Cmr4 [Acidobacteriota bacterium]